MGAALGRVSDAATFRELRRAGRRVRSGPITVTWLPDLAEGPPRLAFAIGRPVGNAVVRNRLRRRFRALFAELALVVRPGTYLVSAAPAAAPLDYGDLRRTLWTALAQFDE